MIENKDDLLKSLCISKDGLSVRNLLDSYVQIKDDLIYLTIKKENERKIVANYSKKKKDIRIFEYQEKNLIYYDQEIIRSWYSL